MKLKKIIFLASLAGISVGLTGCFSSGYIQSEPSYVQHSRPPQPSSLHVWVDGNWGWNPVSHVYVQKDGYWQKPFGNRTYQAGHWQQSAKGKSWKSGKWQKKDK